MENHAAMVALFFMYYNFSRVHQSLRVTPAMAAGISDHVWEIEEIVSLLVIVVRTFRTTPKCPANPLRFLSAILVRI